MNSYSSIETLFSSIKNLSAEEQINLISQLSETLSEENKQKLIEKIINKDSSYIFSQINSLFNSLPQKDKEKLLETLSKGSNQIFVLGGSQNHITNNGISFRSVCVHFNNKMDFEEFSEQLNKLQQFEPKEIEFLGNLFSKWIKNLTDSKDK